jgi:hypothetical protein
MKKKQPLVAKKIPFISSYLEAKAQQSIDNFNKGLATKHVFKAGDKVTVSIIGWPTSHYDNHIGTVESVSGNIYMIPMAHVLFDDFAIDIEMKYLAYATQFQQDNYNR